MASLTVRHPQFRIDDTVPFQWQPANPSFGLFGNTFTFLAIAFERYIVSATREAMPRITDPDVAEEADLFVRQEAQHARAHRAHADPRRNRPEAAATEDLALGAPPGRPRPSGPVRPLDPEGRRALEELRALVGRLVQTAQ